MNSAASGSLIALLTIARVAGIVVLATEALFLWTLRREAIASGASLPQGPAVARFFWAATPAAILAGLALWCLSSVSPLRQAPPAAVALQESTELAH